MKIRITDTNTIEELAVYIEGGIEWTADLIGNTGALQDPEQFRALDDDPDGAEYECDRDTYEWWQGYIDGCNATDTDIRDLSDALAMDEGDVRRLVYDRVGGVDLEDERGAVISAIADIRDEALIDPGPEVVQWQGEYLYKLIAIPRDEIDEGAEAITRLGVTPRYAHDLVGIDEAGLRRVDIRLDSAFGREPERDEMDAIREAIESAPAETSAILARYVREA